VLTYGRAIVIGVLQGATELFPVSSLGHAVLVPAWLGWGSLVRAEAAQESFYLAFVVALHVATALALLFYFRAEWVRIIGGFFRTLRTRRIETPDERMAWLLVVATTPAGVMGLALEHTLRTIFAKPLAAAVFLILNGLILLAGEGVRRRAAVRRVAHEHATKEGEPNARRLDTLEFKEAAAVGVAQVGALFAGISRSGITMVAGLVRGLDHEDAARFSFLLATPIIAAAGLLEVPQLFQEPAPLGLYAVSALLAGGAAYLSARFLIRYFRSGRLDPYGWYCGALGLVALALLR
jgi:undecaprenyl-diphosphatase